MNDFWTIKKWQPVTCLLSERRWTGIGMVQEVANRLSFLKKAGGKTGQVWFIFHNNSLEFIADLLAIWAFGGKAAALSPGLSKPELQNLISFANPFGILSKPGEKPQMPNLDVPVFDLSACPPAKETGVTFREDFELILFTSGTTGTPKGVVHTKSSIEAKISQNLDYFGKEIFERSLCLLSSHFVAGLFSNILTPLSAGGEVFLFSDPGVQGLSKIGGIVDTHKISMVNTVPSLWNVILKSSKPPKRGSLKLVSVVSAPLKEDQKEAIKIWAKEAEVLSLYGTTETGGWNTIGDKQSMGRGRVGHILGGEAAILDAKGKIVGSGEGELLVKSPSVMSQYLNRPDLNRKAFIDGWFKTGDFAEIDEAGNITIKGRVSGQINRAGVKIIPEEVEDLLVSHPDIKGACVFAYPDPVLGEGVAAAIELKKGVEENFPSIRRWCQERARSILVPEKWFLLETLPLNERGKIDRIKIKNHFIQEQKL